MSKDTSDMAEKCAILVEKEIKRVQDLCSFEPKTVSEDRLRFAILGRIDGLRSLAAQMRALKDAP